MVKNTVTVGMVLGLWCGSLHQYSSGVRAEIIITEKYGTVSLVVYLCHKFMLVQTFCAFLLQKLR